MTVREIPRAQWRSYFDETSRQLVAQKVDIIVTGSSLGAQIEAERLPLLGLTYDPNDDAFTIVAEHLEHAIPSPKQILVEEGPRGLASVEVVGGDDTKQIVSLAPAS